MAGMLKFSDREIEEIIYSKAFDCAGMPERNRAIFVTQLCLGPRISELMRLTLGEVVNKKGQIKNEVTLTKTKNGKNRTVKVLNPLIFYYLPPWLKKLNAMGFIQDDSPLFPGRGRSANIGIKQVRNIYKDAINELDIGERHSTHSCRKTWACQTYDWLCEEMRNGANISPLRELKDIGGWESIEATAAYIADHITRANESQVAIYSGVLESLRRSGKLPKSTKRE